MAFGNNQYAKIWEVVDKGNYAEVSISSSKKNKLTQNYETDFSCKFVRFVGNAYKQRPMQGQKIKLTDCAVTNVYEKNGRKEYLKNPSYVVFAYELQDGGNGSVAPQPNWEEFSTEDSLPF
jgi:hypothetical protein